MTLSIENAYDFILTALCVWRESRGEPVEGKRAVANVIRNRAMNPGWWGRGWAGCVLKPLQFSSFNANDPNAKLLPQPTDQSWVDCLRVTQEVFEGSKPDPTLGADHYFDDSIAAPEWTRKMTPTLKVGRLNFYKQTL